MFVYVENSKKKKPQKKKRLLELINEVSKIVGYKVNIQTQSYFYILAVDNTRNPQNHILYNCSSRMKYLGINLTKLVHDL